MAPSPEQEIRDLRQAFWSDRDPDGRAFVSLADACRRSGDLDQALELLEEGLDRHPGFSSAHVVSAWVHRDRGAHDEAEAAFRAVLELDGENGEALRGLGELAAAQGREGEALRWLRRLSVLEPGNEAIARRIEEIEGARPAPGSGPADAAAGARAGVEAGESAAEPSFDIADIGGIGGPAADEEAREEEAGISADLADFAIGGGELSLDEPAEEAEAASPSDAPAEPPGDVRESFSLDDLSVEAPEEAPGDVFEPFAAIEPEAADAHEPPPIVGEPEAAGALEDSPAEGEPDPADALEGSRAEGEPDPAATPGGIPAFDAPEEASADADGGLGADAGADAEEAPRAGRPPEAPHAPAAEAEAAREPAPEAETERAADEEDGVYTRTMAELYVRQGLHDRALRVYERLLAGSPDDAELRRLAQELRERASGEAAAAGTPEADARTEAARRADEEVESLARDWAERPDPEDDLSTPFAWSGDEREADDPGTEDGAPVGDYFRALLAWEPGAPAAPPAAVEEAAGPDTSEEQEPAVEPVGPATAPDATEEPRLDVAEPAPAPSPRAADDAAVDLADLAPTTDTAEEPVVDIADLAPSSDTPVDAMVDVADLAPEPDTLDETVVDIADLAPATDTAEEPVVDIADLAPSPDTADDPVVDIADLAPDPSGGAGEPDDAGSSDAFGRWLDRLR